MLGGNTRLTLKLKGNGNDLRWLAADLTVHAGQYANMLLDVNGKMVRGTAFAALLLCVFVCFLSSVLTLALLSCAQVSATEECVGPMRLTQEPIQVRAEHAPADKSCFLLVCLHQKLGFMFLSMNFSALCYACVAQLASLFL